MIIKSNARFIWETEGSYTLSKAQARAIFVDGANTFQCECWRRLKDIDKVTRVGCDQSIKQVFRGEDGSMVIGCTTLTKAEVARIKRWARSARTTKATKARRKKAA